MLESIATFFKKIFKPGHETDETSKDTAKERLHLVLMQDRANVSADFLDLMKQEIIEVIKKYIDVDEKEIDVRLTNQSNEDGTNGAPALYANIPILNIRNDVKGEKLREHRLEQKIESPVQGENEKIENEQEEQEKQEEQHDIDEINSMVENDDEDDEEDVETVVEVIEDNQDNSEIQNEKNASVEEDNIANEEEKTEQKSEN